jgi:hypothetical protein
VFVWFASSCLGCCGHRATNLYVKRAADCVNAVRCIYAPCLPSAAAASLCERRRPDSIVLQRTRCPKIPVWTGTGFARILCHCLCVIATVIAAAACCCILCMLRTWRIHACALFLLVRFVSLYSLSLSLSLSQQTNKQTNNYTKQWQTRANRMATDVLPVRLEE